MFEFTVARIADLNLTVEEIYHPELHQYLIMLTLITYPIVLVLYLCAVMAALRRTPSTMRFYRTLLVYNLTSGLLFDTMLFLCHPVAMLPVSGVYVQGYLDLGDDAIVVVIAFLFASFVALVHAIVSQIAFRILVTFDARSHWIIGQLQRPVVYLTLMAIIFVLLEIPLLLPFVIDPPQAKQFRAALAQVPAFAAVIAHHPHFNGYLSGVNGETFSISILTMLVLGGLCVPFFLAMLAAFYLRLRYIKKQLASSSYRLHVMLFWALTTQLLLCLVLIMIPLDAALLAWALRWRSGNYVVVASLFIFIYYPLFEISSQLFLVTPYRQFLLQMFARFLRLKKNDVYSSRVGISGISSRERSVNLSPVVVRSKSAINVTHL